MTQRRAIEKAIALLRPVGAAVSQRAPRGMTAGQADQVVMRISSALDHLFTAAKFYERADERRES